MRKVIVSGIAAFGGLALCTAAIAADVAPASKARPVALAAYNWSGFYLGGNVGYGWASQDTSLPIAGTTTVFSNTVKPQGAIGGGQIGLNWQTGTLVWGLEADIQASGQSKSSTVRGAILGVAASETVSAKIDRFGTVRGRVGYASDRWLPYLTAGWVYGHAKETVTLAVTGFAPVSVTSSGNTNNGWTVGGGLETALTGNWTGKVEYLYVDFGTDSSASIPGVFTAGHITDNVVRVGLNHRL